MWASGLCLLFLWSVSFAWAQTRFRPESERESMGKKTAYEEWLEKEGVPVYRGMAIPSLARLELGPWKRIGAAGAYVALEGAGGIVDGWVCEIAPGSKTNPEKHFFEEQVLVLTGEGETHVWQTRDGKKQVVVWKKGTVFAPPLNTWHQHFNKGSAPARLVAITNAPMLMDLYHSAELLFNIQTDVTERYGGEANYFDPEISRDWAPFKGKHSLSVVNVIRDVWSAQLNIAGQGYGDLDRHFVLSNNRMGAHIESFPAGTYERAHRHGPGASIIFLAGTGYTLFWPQEAGIRPYSEGRREEVVKIQWEEGTMIAPLNQWFHQWFNTGSEPARFIKLGSPFGPGGRNTVFRMNRWITEEAGGYMIKFREQDPLIEAEFGTELRSRGATLHMPSKEELIALEKEAEELTGGMLQQVDKPKR